MKKPYLTKDEAGAPDVSPDLVQSWHHTFSVTKARNEPMILRWWLERSREEQTMGLEALVLLARFRFATLDQLTRDLQIRGLPTDSLEPLLEELVRNRVLNCFVLALQPLEEFPEDALKIWCLDWGGRHILLHFYREDFVYWHPADGQRGAGQILSCLSTLRFFLALLEVRRENLRFFDPVFDVSIGRRDARFSALFELRQGETRRKFVLENVRSADLPAAWLRKVSEQICPFLEERCWKRYLPEEPVFLLLADTSAAALEAADLFHRRTQSENFRVTTDQEVAKGMESARFFRYVPAPEGTGALQPVRAALFTSPAAGPARAPETPS